MLKASVFPVLCQAPHSMSHPFLVTQLIILAPISAEGEQAKTASTSSDIYRRVVTVKLRRFASALFLVSVEKRLFILNLTFQEFCP